MDFTDIQPDEQIALFVKNVMVLEETDTDQKTVLPFFADGYPGLVFYEAARLLTAYPQNKAMPPLFLYGQTLHPMELVFEGSYRMIVFRFYPFILKSFFGISPKGINNGCYDLQEFNTETNDVITQLRSGLPLEKQIALITVFLYSLFQIKKQSLDTTLKQALQLIISAKGKTPINEVSRQLNINERTLERRFADETGLSPKQFAKIIQFQSSLEQLTVKDFNKLTDVVYENGFADQSHFIKVFKAFTGKTPKAFVKN